MIGEYMNNKSNTIIIVIFAIVAITGLGFYALNHNEGVMMNDNNSVISSDAKTSRVTVTTNKNSSDYRMMAAVSGEKYDRLFLANMIAHHQGAIDMANLALTNAKHQEVKDLATAIFSAQTKEINNMTAWQGSWSYPASTGSAMMDHSAMGMEDTGAGMLNALTGKTGDDFDKEFLTQMIAHHQSAIDMSAVGSTNSFHQEVKDLTAAIITAQTSEIKQMRQWQKDWGFSS
jgi:uncharacterized protein (DUF305 family)